MAGDSTTAAKAIETLEAQIELLKEGWPRIAKTKSQATTARRPRK